MALSKGGTDLVGAACSPNAAAAFPHRAGGAVHLVRGLVTANMHHWRLLHPPPTLSYSSLSLQCIKYCLENRFGFKDSGCIVVLTDDQKHPDFTSTRANIARGIQWLMMDQRPGDSLFFHFSGHGSQQADRSGDELDGWVPAAVTPL